MVGRLKLGKIEVETRTSLEKAYVYVKNLVELVTKKGGSIKDILGEEKVK